VYRATALQEDHNNAGGSQESHNNAGGSQETPQETPQRETEQTETD